MNQHMFEPNSNLLYGGTRQDCHSIVHQDFKGETVMVRVMGAIDLPFSFAVDTIVLPIDLYHWTERRPSVDPLAGWKRVGGFGPMAGETNTNLAGAKRISDDVDQFIEKHKFKFGPGTAAFDNWGDKGYYENGNTYAVMLNIPSDDSDSVSTFYILFYDQAGTRNRIVKYKVWKAASFG